MKPLRLLLLAAVVVAAAGPLPAQDYTPPPSQPPDEATQKAIAERADKLDAAVQSLHRRGAPEPLVAEAEVYLKAATWITRHNEFYQKDYAAWTLDALDRGLLRATLLSRGEYPWLRETGHAVVRAYRSHIDGSVQPYAVTFPEDYGKDARRKWRLDVVLHGRDTSLTEVKFLHQHGDDRAAAKGQDWVQLDIYGRGNNAYRWAGENDVVEAVDAFLSTERTLGRAELLDPARTVLRGFSMGGAGTWHLGLHRPDRWCVLGPGAGFTSTHGYIKNLPDPLAPYQEACLTIYDAVDYAENAVNVPIIAYAGSEDPQFQASRNIEAKLRSLNISAPFTLLVAQGLKHEFPPEWQKKAEEEYSKYVAKGRPQYPPHVHFVTYTLRYPQCDWIKILGLEQHYQRTVVDAEQTETGYIIKTANVRNLYVGLPMGASRQPLALSTDDQKFEARPVQSGTGALELYLTKRDGTWSAVLPQKLLTEKLRHAQKVPGIQGPIDDAFTHPFLCVHGTGKPWHEATQKYADAALKRFQEEWSKYLRGDLEIKDDVEVTSEDIRDRNLILFGDPASNSLIAEILPDLPLKWTREQVCLAGANGPSAEHVPVLIYPSPLNTDRYIVLNSGHTFHAADFQGTNALLYPRLGDYAILRMAATDKDPLAAEVVTAGLFDDFWQVGKK
jgi:pimeloyl-ACP methyl ester carboxylesterase